MKKSKIIKLIQNEYTELSSKDQLKSNYDIPKEHNLFNDLMFTENNIDIKNRSRNLINRLLQFRDKLSFSSSETTIRIRSNDISYKKSNSQSKSPSNKYVLESEIDEFSIEIIKDVGFMINYKSNRTAFNDKEIYNDVIDEMKRSFKELNIKNFNNLYTEIMKDTGLARESNLDDLLD